MKIQHQTEEGKGRFVVSVEGKEAGYIKYEIMPNRNLKANGTLVYDEFRDQHLGKPLFDTLLQFAKDQDVKIFPTCPYVVAMFQKHPELNEYLDEDYQKK
jgi:uncharacterized protein